MCFFGSVYSCYCVMHAYLPISGFPVSYVNVHCNVFLFDYYLVLFFFLWVCRCLGSFSSYWTTNTGPVGIRIVLRVSCSYYEIMVVMVMLNIVGVSLMYYSGNSFFCLLLFFCLQYKLGTYYHYYILAFLVCSYSLSFV